MQLLSGITPRVDTCVPMIVQQARRVYQGMDACNKRWMDEEDVIQEGALAALKADRTFVADGISHGQSYQIKFSSYCYKVLFTNLHDTFIKGYKATKRVTDMKEIDAPIKDSETDRIRDSIFGESHEDNQHYEQAQLFVRVCQLVRGPAAELLISVMIGGSPIGMRAIGTVRALTLLRKAVALLGVTYEDFHGFVKNVSARKIALTMLAGGVTMVPGLDIDARVLECIECRGQFSLRDVRSGKFVADTLTCSNCYKQMAEAPAEISCFGKPKTDKHEGYSEKDIECRLLCMDRNACKQHLTSGKENAMSENEVVETDELEDADDLIGDTFDDEPVKPVKKVNKAKSASKPAKKAEAKKPSKKEAKPAKKAKPEAKASEVRGDSLTAKLFGLLEKGATREAMCKATGWTDHSVRGFLSGAPKRFGVKFRNEKKEGGKRTYFLVGKAPVAKKK